MTLIRPDTDIADTADPPWGTVLFFCINTATRSEQGRSRRHTDWDPRGISHRIVVFSAFLDCINTNISGWVGEVWETQEIYRLRP